MTQKQQQPVKTAIRQFIVTVKHDNGQSKIRVNAMNEDAARHLVCMAESCSDSAIVRVREAAYMKKSR